MPCVKHMPRETVRKRSYSFKLSIMILTKDFWFENSRGIYSGLFGIRIEPGYERELLVKRTGRVKLKAECEYLQHCENCEAMDFVPLPAMNGD